MTSRSPETPTDIVSLVGKTAAFVLFAAVLMMPTRADFPNEARRLAAVAVLMGVLWLTQAVHIAVTSLIPLLAFPLLGIQASEAVSQHYMNRYIILFLAGFVIALGIEKWGLHRRIALHIVRWLGTSLKRVILGFMLSTAFLSMWISNTASTLLMLPIGLALLTSLRELSEDSSAVGAESSLPSDPSADLVFDRLGLVLMLGIAYSASIGGFTTLVGTPTNFIFFQVWHNRFPEGPEVSAGEWMVAMVPLGAIFLVCAWLVLVYRLPELPGVGRLDRRFFTERLRSLGRMSHAERWMLAVFVTTAALWIFRKPLSLGAQPILPGWGDGAERLLLWLGADSDLAARGIDDSTVAIGMALLMFFIPVGRNTNRRVRYLMDWETAERLPWSILLLFGGGFALADGFETTGLARWLGDWFATAVAGWPVWMLVLSVCLLLTFLTEFTSNVATISSLLPILIGTAISLEVDPRVLMIPATLSASCAFMLPIATPPNAIVFSSGRVSVRQMACYGIWLNLLGAVLITLAMFLLFEPQLGLSFHGLPDWAAAAAPKTL